MSKNQKIEVITYEQERLNFFTKAMNLAQKRYNRLFKIFKDEPYLSEGTTIVSDAGRETQFYHDVVEMLENGSRKQSEGEWKQTKEPMGWHDVDCVECSACGESWVLNDNLDFDLIVEYWHYCPNCGAKMKGGAE